MTIEFNRSNAYQQEVNALLERSMVDVDGKLIPRPEADGYYIEEVSDPAAQRTADRQQSFGNEKQSRVRTLYHSRLARLALSGIALMGIANTADNIVTSRQLIEPNLVVDYTDGIAHLELVGEWVTNVSNGVQQAISVFSHGSGGNK